MLHNIFPLMTGPKNGKLDVLLIFSIGRSGHIATHYELLKGITSDGCVPLLLSQ